MMKDQDSYKFTPGGTHSIARQRLFSEIKGRPPIFVKWAKGAHFSDGQDILYLDYHNAFGAIVVGHAHPSINAAVNKQLEKGSMYGLNHTQEIKLCKKIIRGTPNFFVKLDCHQSIF